MASVNKVKEGGIFNYFEHTEEYSVCQIKMSGLRKKIQIKIKYNILTFKL